MRFLNFDTIKLSLIELLNSDNDQYMNEIVFYFDNCFKKEEVDYVSEYCKSNISNSNMITILAYIYYLQKNKDLSIELFNKAINMNNSCAMRIFARNYCRIVHPCPNFIEITRLYNKSIELGSSDAICMLADFRANYEIKSNDEIIELYKKSIDLGNVNAMYKLAIYYVCICNHKSGEEYDRAKELFNKACALDNYYALDDMARCYRFGEKCEYNFNKVEIDIREAIKIYSKMIKIYPFCLNIKEKIIDLIKEKPSVIFEMITETENENIELKTYITHLETLPLGKEYQDALNDFNNHIDN